MMLTPGGAIPAPTVRSRLEMPGFGAYRRHTGKAPLTYTKSGGRLEMARRNAADALNVVHSFRWWNLKVDSGILTLTRSRPIT